LFYNSPKENSLDWARAIDTNKTALIRIVAALVSLLVAQGGVARIPAPVYQLIARALHPAESAVRRLIVMAARGLVVPVPERRPMPPGLVIAGSGEGRIAFQLFDTRKHFGDADETPPVQVTGPRIRSIGDPSPRAVFLAKFERPADGRASEAETLRVSRRLAALKSALENLPRQAKRMTRWLLRRSTIKNAKFTSPLRPGPPPGHLKKPRDELDDVLRECHALAWDALRNDTS
jgi:hypothetical protein